MNLNVNDDELIEAPTADQVKRAVVSLGPDEFAILARGDQEYIQAYLNDDGTFRLEYRAGSADAHYAAAEDPTDSQSVATAFVAYLNEKPDWNSNWEWEPVEFDDKE